jgi:1-acyl-sn-glycerol-3-phosphate acyltransferase
LEEGRRRIRAGAFRRWSRGVLRLLGVELKVEGTPPAAPFLMVANHLSYLDIVVLASQMDAVFVAKREVRTWPVIGFLAALMDTIFIDRTAPRDTVRVMERLERAIQQGDGVVLFAEATSSEGRGVLPFRSALLAWAARAAQPVHHASLSYRTPEGAVPAHLAVCWWGEMTFGPHVAALATLPRIYATVAFGAEPIQELDRKRLAERLHEAVRQRFVPVIVEPGRGSMDRLKALDGNCQLLDQGIKLLQRMDDEAYAASGAAPDRSPAGSHFRHVLDHYQAFLAGLAEGRIDYDARRRDPRLEQDRGFAVATALGLLTDMSRLPPSLASRPIDVSVQCLADSDEPDWCSSTVQRELQFLASHTVHHYALMKELLRQAGVDPGEEFGVAPSTLAHRRSVAECAR